MPGRPEGQAPPSGAVPVFDEGLLGRGLVSGHVGVIGGYRGEPGWKYRTRPAAREFHPPGAPVPVQNLDRADSVAATGDREAAARDCPRADGSDRSHHGERLSPRGVPVHLPLAAVPPLHNSSSGNAGLTVPPNPSADRPDMPAVIGAK